MRAVHAGKRRSVKRAPRQYNRKPVAPKVHPEENPLFPGYHTCVVPRHDPRDPRASSPVARYIGMGYEEACPDDPRRNAELTGHSDEILMKIPLKTYLQRENERMEYHNGLLDGMIAEMGSMPDQPGEGQVWFERSSSGLKRHEKISLAEAGANIGRSVSGASPDEAGD